MFAQAHPKLGRERLIARREIAALRAFLCLLLVCAPALLIGLGQPRAAETAVTPPGNPSGLPLPRFVTTRSNPVNVRLGPGTKYGVAWVYLKAGQPVEIIQEFDVWRKIRDVDGSEGWLHQNLLIGNRAGLVAPWEKDAEAKIPLHGGRSDDSGVVAWLMPNLRVDIKDCDGAWCEVMAASHPADGGSPQSYRGYMAEDQLWGVLQGERFD